ncbi:T9SS type A sorting domain-containing protein [Hyphobacterium sp. CCMP332]|nr:T9SS type A sorting domain-containing protein [Hyphobacterium sp. CCMP332]
MKVLGSILLSLIAFSVSFGQGLNISSWTYNFSSNYDFFIDDNDHIVLSNSSGIYIYDDSVLIQQVSNTNRPASKGRFGNILFSADNHGITSWTSNGSYTFPGDSSYFIPFPVTMIQLSDGRILTENGLGDSYAILDSNGITVLPLSNTQSCYSAPMLEINPDLYLFGYNGFVSVDSLGYYNKSTNTVTSIASSDIVGANFILGYDNSIGNKIFMHYVDGIVEVENNTVLNIEYFSSHGVSISHFHSTSGFTSLPNNKYVVMDTNYLMVYDGSSLVIFDSTMGWNVGSGLYVKADANSSGTVYFSIRNRMYKITAPILTSIDSETKRQKFNVYPNPNNGSCEIHSSLTSGSFEISLINLQGKTIFKRVVANLNGSFQFPNDLRDGIYILKAEEECGVHFFNTKLILKRD